MKADKTVFTCDFCGDVEEIVYKAGYPYDKGWLYLHIIDGRTRNGRNYSLKDKHFCDSKCQIAFVTKFLKEELKK